jgi:hypothetical protein
LVHPTTSVLLPASSPTPTTATPTFALNDSVSFASAAFPGTSAFRSISTVYATASALAILAPDTADGAAPSTLAAAGTPATMSTVAYVLPAVTFTAPTVATAALANAVSFAAFPTAITASSVAAAFADAFTTTTITATIATTTTAATVASTAFAADAAGALRSALVSAAAQLSRRPRCGLGCVGCQRRGLVG